MLKKKLAEILTKVLPRQVQASLKNYRILSKELGQYESIKRWDCRDKSGDEIPWYTYPAIEYLGNLDFRDADVFEYGSGNSSVFWGKRCNHLVCIEDDEEWYQKIRGKLPANVDYQLVEKDEDAYVSSISRYEQEFDVIIVDGNYRHACARRAVTKLKSDGLVILDNSDWFEKTAEFLRGEDLIEVDMAGFGPINGYRWVTSFFFTRNVKLKSLSRQPRSCIGGVAQSEQV